jgi:aryl-alcohol dehydrogenase-like predicted oxidoreductase
LPVCERYGIGVVSWSPLAGGWLSGRFGAGKDNSSRRADRIPARYDLSLPENQRKLEAVDRLVVVAEAAGLTLVELAIGFVLSHRVVTSPIVGPRTMDQMEPLLKAADVRLTAEVLDRIDEIVPPGLNFNRFDGGYLPPWLSDPALRRR